MRPILISKVFQPGKKVEPKENQKVQKSHVGNVTSYLMSIHQILNLNLIPRYENLKFYLLTFFLFFRFFAHKYVLTYFQICHNNYVSLTNAKSVSRKKMSAYFCMEGGTAQMSTPT